MVLDHEPDAEECSELATFHLEDFPAEEAYATIEITHSPPEWLELYEQDQMGAYLRDLPNACILIIYMQEGAIDQED